MPHTPTTPPRLADYLTQRGAAIYQGDALIGTMATPEAAAVLVRVNNAHAALVERLKDSTMFLNTLDGCEDIIAANRAVLRKAVQS